MSEGKLKKHAVSPNDIYNFFFRNNFSKNKKILDAPKFVSLLHIDEAKKAFPMTKQEALRLYDIFKDKPEEHRGSWIKLTFWAIEWLYGDSE